jgi:hypothetical protein
MAAGPEVRIGEVSGIGDDGSPLRNLLRSLPLATEPWFTEM